MYLVLVLNKEKEGIKGQSSLQDKKEDSRDCSAFESVDREVLLTRKMSCQDTAGVQRIGLEAKRAGRSPEERQQGALCNTE